MPTYRIEIPGKGTYRVESERELTDAQAYAAALQQSQAPEGPRGFGPSLKRGAAQLASDTGLGITSLFGSDESVKNAARGDRERLDKIARPTQWSDVENAYGAPGGGILSALPEFGAYARDTLAANLPQTAAALGGAKLGATAGSAVAPGIGTLVGGALGAGAAMFPSFMGSNIGRQVEEGDKAGTPEAPLSRGAAATAALGQTAMESAETLFFFGRLGLGKSVRELLNKPVEVVEKELVKKAEQSLLKAAGKGAVRGTAEIPVEVAQQILERAQAGLPLTGADALKEYKESAIGAAVVGPVMGSAGNIHERYGARGDLERLKAGRAAQEEERKKQEDITRRADPAYRQQLDAQLRDIEGQIADLRSILNDKTVPSEQKRQANEQRRELEVQRKSIMGELQLPDETAPKSLEQRRAEARAKREGQGLPMDEFGSSIEGQRPRNMVTDDFGNVIQNEPTTSEEELNRATATNEQVSRSLNANSPVEARMQELQAAYERMGEEEKARVAKLIQNPFESEIPEQLDIIAEQDQANLGEAMGAERERLAKQRAEQEGAEQAAIKSEDALRASPLRNIIFGRGRKIENESRESAAIQAIDSGNVNREVQTILGLKGLEGKRDLTKPEEAESTLPAIEARIKQLEDARQGLYAENVVLTTPTGELTQEGTRALGNEAILQELKRLKKIADGTIAGTTAERELLRKANSAPTVEMPPRTRDMRNREAADVALDNQQQIFERLVETLDSVRRGEGIRGQEQRLGPTVQATVERMGREAMGASVDYVDQYRRLMGSPALTNDERLRLAYEMKPVVDELIQRMQAQPEKSTEMEMTAPAQMRGTKVVQGAEFQWVNKDRRPLGERPFGRPQEAVQALQEQLVDIQTKYMKPRRQMTREDLRGQTQSTTNAREKAAGRESPSVPKFRRYVAGKVQEVLRMPNLQPEVSDTMGRALDALEADQTSPETTRLIQEQADRILKGADLPFTVNEAPEVLKRNRNPEFPGTVRRRENTDAALLPQIEQALARESDARRAFSRENSELQGDLFAPTEAESRAQATASPEDIARGKVGPMATSERRQTAEGFQKALGSKAIEARRAETRPAPKPLAEEQERSTAERVAKGRRLAELNEQIRAIQTNPKYGRTEVLRGKSMREAGVEHRMALEKRKLLPALVKERDALKKELEAAPQYSGLYPGQRELEAKRDGAMEALQRAVDLAYADVVDPLQTQLNELERQVKALENPKIASRPEVLEKAREDLQTLSDYLDRVETRAEMRAMAVKDKRVQAVLKRLDAIDSELEANKQPLAKKTAVTEAMARGADRVEQDVSKAKSDYADLAERLQRLNESLPTKRVERVGTDYAAATKAQAVARQKRNAAVQQVEKIQNALEKAREARDKIEGRGDKVPGHITEAIGVYEEKLVKAKRALGQARDKYNQLRAERLQRKEESTVSPRPSAETSREERLAQAREEAAYRRERVANAPGMKQSAKAQKKSMAAAQDTLRKFGDRPPRKQQPYPVRFGETDKSPDAEYTEWKPKAGSDTYRDPSDGTVYRVGKAPETTLDAKEGQAIADRVTDKLPEGVKFIYAPTYADLPGKARTALFERGEDMDTRPKGAVLNDGTVVVVGEAHANAADLEETIAHELIGHYSVGTLIGPDGMADLTKRLFANGGENVQDVARILGVWDETVTAAVLAERMPNLTETQRQQMVVSELVAHASEGRPVAPSGVAKLRAFVGEIVEAFKRWARSAGMNNAAKMNAKEVYNLIKQARANFGQDMGEYRPTINGTPAFRRGEAKMGGLSQRSVQTTEKVVAPRKSFLDKLRANLLGLNIETQLFDARAPIERVAERMKDHYEAVQMMHAVRLADQRMNWFAAVATQGKLGVKEVKGPNGQTYRKVEVEGGANLMDVAKALGGLKKHGFNDVGANHLLTTYLAGIRAKRVGLESLNYDMDITPSDIAALEADLDKMPEVKAILDKAREQYNEYNRGLIEFAVQSGALSKKKGSELKAQNDYIPFYRVNDKGLAQLFVGNEAPITIGDIAHQPYLAPLVKDNSKIVDVFTSALQNTTLLTDMALRNFAARNVAWTLKNLKLAKFVKAGRYTKGDNHLRFMMDGWDDERVAIIDTSENALFNDIPSDMIVKGLEGMSLVVPAAYRALALPATVLRKAVTLNPLYPFRQVLKDAMSMGMTSGANWNPATSVLKTVKEYGKDWAGKSETTKKLERSGIVGGRTYQGTTEDLNQIMRRLAGDGQSLFSKAVAKQEQAGLRADAATRAMIYNDLVSKGMWEMEAELTSLDAMNFTKRGLSPTMFHLNQMIPFFNAGMQSLNVLYRSLGNKGLTNKHLNTRAAIMRGGMTLAAMTMAYVALAGDEDWYENTPDEIKYNAWLVKLPGVEEPLKVPIPYEIGLVFKAVPEALYNMAFRDADAKRTLKAMAGLTMNSMPLNFPQALKPAVELATNKDFYTGADIESEREQRVDPFLRYRDNTTELAKMLGSTGAMSPVQVDHLIKGYTSGLGVALASALNPLLRTGENVRPEPRASDTPIVGGMFQPVDGGAIIDQMYEFMNKANQAEATYKQLIADGKEDEAERYIEENMDKLVFSKFADKFTAQMGRITAYERAVRADRNMTPQEKRAELDSVKRMKIDYAKSVREAVREQAR